MTGCYDVVLLELTGAGDGHLDESGFAAALAELRRHGAVSDATRVVAVHVGHANPPPAELERRLTDWGAQLLPDGAVIEAGAPPAAQSRLPRRVLILGGARSGKSREAERRLAAEPVVTYVATGLPNPADPEWSARIAWHRANRPAHWRTLETLDVAAVLRSEPGPLLVDCFSLWLAAHLGDEAAANDLLTAWRDSDCRVVAVSNEVGSGVVPASAAGRAFRDELGRLNARLAATADEVWLMHAGLAQRLR
jgi:adenosylcobinamide kinase/adenosylcobinamide-phosphate guanylyltransferase